MLLSEILLEDDAADALRKVRLAMGQARQVRGTGDSAADVAQDDTARATGGGTIQSAGNGFDMAGLAAAADAAIAAKNRSELLRVLIDGPDATIIQALRAQGIEGPRQTSYVQRYRDGVQRRLIRYLDQKYTANTTVPNVRPPVGSWSTRAQEDMRAFADAILRAVG